MTELENFGDGAAKTWNEYAALVLSELRRLTAGSEITNEKLDKLAGKFVDQQEALVTFKTLTETRLSNLQKDFDDHISDNRSKFEDPQTGLFPRIKKLEDDELVGSAISRYKWWIIGGLFAIFAAIIPAITSYLQYLSSLHQ